MEKKSSIINWELYSKIKKPKLKLEKEFKVYKKPLLGRFLDKMCDLGQKLIKKPIFFILFVMNLILLGEYFRCTLSGEQIESFRWVTTTSFLFFFGYLTFLNKN